MMLIQCIVDDVDVHHVVIVQSYNSVYLCPELGQCNQSLSSRKRAFQMSYVFSLIIFSYLVLILGSVVL